MRPVAAEVVLAVATTAVIVGFVLLLGSALVQPVMQPDDWTTAETRGCLEAPLKAVSESGVEGVARLCVGRQGIQSVLQVSGLHEGEAYTAWLAYFDQPSVCFLTQCGFIDLRGDDPVGVLGRVGGAIAPSTRELELRADLRDLHPSRGSQITLVVLGHGVGSEADGRARARQLLTPQMFELGSPMAGAVKDTSRGWLRAQAIFTLERGSGSNPTGRSPQYTSTPTPRHD